jgi:adenylyltransferase/sulfurtransferase
VSPSDEELERYSRQLVMPEWSGAAQERLARARVMVVGLGALGTPVAAYLAGAGVGRLELVDSDSVELSNLHRQTLHGTPEIGLAKVTSAARRLADLNPHVEVDALRVRLDPGTAPELVAGASLVVDCSDSFSTRYAVNDACCAARVPLVEAGVLGLEGLLLSISPGESACYRCTFPTPPPPDALASCREAGVLGPMAGIVGSYQALEALKLLAGVGEPLLDRVLRLDGRDASQTLVATRRRPDCPACADAAAAAQSEAMGPTAAPVR